MLPKFLKDILQWRSPTAFPVWFRLVLGTIAGAVSIPLILAASLTPEVKGFGTHQQLGLPECSFIKLYEMPCPSCGMTTAWSFLMHGQWQQSLHANAAGTFLAILALFTVIWCGLASVTGRFWIIQPTDWLFLSWVIGMTTFILARWVYICFL